MASESLAVVGVGVVDETVLAVWSFEMVAVWRHRFGGMDAVVEPVAVVMMFESLAWTDCCCGTDELVGVVPCAVDWAAAVGDGVDHRRDVGVAALGNNVDIVAVVAAAVAVAVVVVAVAVVAGCSGRSVAVLLCR